MSNSPNRFTLLKRELKPLGLNLVTVGTCLKKNYSTITKGYKVVPLQSLKRPIAEYQVTKDDLCIAGFTASQLAGRTLDDQMKAVHHMIDNPMIRLILKSRYE